MTTTSPQAVRTGIPFLGPMMKTLVHHHRRLRTIRDLRKLDDLVLREIGVERGEIPSFADELLAAAAEGARQARAA